jgi:hypothetical protein
VAKKKERLTIKGPKGAGFHWGYSYPGKGNWLLTHDEKDRRLTLRMGATGKEVARLPVNQAEVHQEAWSKDATILAVTTKDGTVKCYRMDKIIEAAAR